MSADTLLLTFGVILCFGGWVALWLGSRLIGAVFGLGLGFVFGVAFSLALGMEAGAAALLQLGCSLMGAIGGVFFIRALNSFLLALVGFLFGILVARLILQMHAGLGGQPYTLTPQIAIILVVVGAAGAGGALWIRRTLAIVVTAFVGATFLCAGFAPLHDMLPWSFVALLLASLAIQMFLSRLFSRKRASKQAGRS
ncbi:MAG: hypothetical protein ACPL7D_11290 [Candidatus Sumerlaeaceae bacterium]|jgi:hypothetical protein